MFHFSLVVVVVVGQLIIIITQQRKRAEQFDNTYPATASTEGEIKSLSDHCSE